MPWGCATWRYQFSEADSSPTLMAVAFAAGLCLQFAVTEIPFLVDAFRTAVLSPGEWGFLLLLAAVPLLAHEVIALVKTITKR